MNNTLFLIALAVIRQNSEDAERIRRQAPKTHKLFASHLELAIYYNGDPDTIEDPAERVRVSQEVAEEIAHCGRQAMDTEHWQEVRKITNHFRIRFPQFMAESAGREATI